VGAENEMALIIREYGYAFGLRYFGFKKHLANDFAQEFYLAYVKYRNGIEDISCWLVGVSAKLAGAFLRKNYRWKRGAGLSKDWYPEPESPERHIIEQLHLRKEMQVISRRARAIIYLRVWRDLPFEHIAKKLNLSTDNVKRIYQRALKKLAIQLVSQRLSPSVR
jgi:RNA polymerase sigma factor (sigma-70 family)